MQQSGSGLYRRWLPASGLHLHRWAISTFEKLLRAGARFDPGEDPAEVMTFACWLILSVEAEQHWGEGSASL
jgi:hypothetical protein